METRFKHAIAALAADRSSGASALLPRAIGVLREAGHAGPRELTEVGRALCEAQPCMGSIWNAVAIALGRDAGAALERFQRRTARVPAALARFAVDLLSIGEPAAAALPLRITTYSASGSVQASLLALRARRPVIVACAEGRPVGEGRAMASAFAAAGLSVEFYTDGAIGLSLDGACAVVVGADTVAPDWIINKAGTRALASAASTMGVPFYVVAGREKFVAPALGARLGLREGPGEEVWASPPVGITVRNLYF